MVFPARRAVVPSRRTPRGRPRRTRRRRASRSPVGGVRERSTPESPPTPRSWSKRFRRGLGRFRSPPPSVHRRPGSRSPASGPGGRPPGSAGPATRPGRRSPGRSAVSPTEGPPTPDLAPTRAPRPAPWPTTERPRGYPRRGRAARRTGPAVDAVGGESGVHGLDRDGRPVRVEGPIDHAHTARSKAADQTVGPHVLGVVGVQGDRPGIRRPCAGVLTESGSRIGGLGQHPVGCASPRFGLRGAVPDQACSSVGRGADSAGALHHVVAQ